MSALPHLKPSDSINIKRTKSRNGCLTCKKKRLKCDETKPSCLNCMRKNIECGGYSINFKWKSFNNESPKIDNKKLDKYLELASFQVTGKSISQISKENDLIKQGFNPESRANSFNGEDNNDKQPLVVRSYNETITTKNHDLNSLAEAAVKVSESPVPVSVPVPVPVPVPSPVPSPSISQSIPSPSPFYEEKTKSVKHNSDFDINLTPSLSAILNFAFNHEVIGEIPSVETMMSPLTMLNQPQIIQQSPQESNELSIPTNSKLSEHEQILKLYSEFTSSIMSIKNGPYENPWRNMILPIAGNYSCLFDSIASMTLFHMAGSNGILSSTTQELRSKGYNYMKKCILELATGLSKMENNNDYSLPADIALATCLNLANCESWDTHTLSGIAHLKGAKSMINKILKILRDQQDIIRQNRCENENNPVTLNIIKQDFQSKLVLVSNFEYQEIHKSSIKSHQLFIPESIQFLFNQWIYFEVLAQMTTSDNFDDKGIDLVATITTMLQNKANEETTTTTSSSDISDLSIDSKFMSNDFDPLLGCGQSLFSILGKVANLVRKIRKTKHESQSKKRTPLNIITLACELKQQLTVWKPSVSNESIEDEQSPKESSWDLSSCISTAEAYKFAALLYLHQAVPEIPSLSSHTLAEKIFILLASIPKCSNLSIVHIFPLLVSSCEAEGGEEREWCESRWQALSEKMWLGNIDRAFEVVKEVWKRKDKMNIIESTTTDDNRIDSSTHWSSIMKEWGWEVLLG
ncbi:unnamed protein product [Candida verbasci]|uniref:Zn(2)-C6 fungal-type domain-containing protein n=1 Tax=Candida verbasci TaxID=1227364 RepID=A0A9W4TUD5_9ASCO|nr:unnamed protein product [Candida verbasci]